MKLTLNMYHHNTLVQWTDAWHPRLRQWILSAEVWEEGHYENWNTRRRTLVDLTFVGIASVMHELLLLNSYKISKLSHNYATVHWNFMKPTLLKQLCIAKAQH